MKSNEMQDVTGNTMPESMVSNVEQEFDLTDGEYQSILNKAGMEDLAESPMSPISDSPIQTPQQGEAGKASSKPTEGEKSATKGHVLKWRGKELTIEDEQELISLAQKGIDYTFKTQQLKEEARLGAELQKAFGEDAYKAISDFRQGLESKDAQKVAKILAKMGIDPLDLALSAEFIDEEPEKEVPENANPQEGEGENLDLQDNPKPANKTDQNKAPEVDQEILANMEKYQQEIPGLSEKLLEAETIMPLDMQQQIISNRQLFEAFLQDIKAGVFDTAITEMIKDSLMREVDFEQEYGTMDRFIKGYANAVQKISTGNENVASETQNNGQHEQTMMQQSLSTRPFAASSSGERLNAHLDEAERIWSDDSYFESIKNKLGIDDF